MCESLRKVDQYADDLLYSQEVYLFTPGSRERLAFLLEVV